MPGKLEVYIGQLMGNDVEKVNQGLLIKESQCQAGGLEFDINDLSEAITAFLLKKKKKKPDWLSDYSDDVEKYEKEGKLRESWRSSVDVSVPKL